MKKFALSLFFPLFVFSLSAYNLTGKIVDNNSSQPIDFANIALYQQGATVPQSGVVTDDNGNFVIQSVADGKYNLQVSFVGYHTYSRNFTVNGKDYNFGSIKLTEDSKMLSEVEVVGMGSQMRFEIDRKVFSVDQNIAAAGGSASEVLENIPSIEVDQEGNVSLRNNESVEVWINGKPSGLTADNRAQILQQMPAESIESIEVITNPSAKFNPEGTAGIINIVLKKDRKAGYYGSVTGGLMIADNGKLGGTLGGNVNISSSKIDAYVNIGYRGMNRVGGSLTDQWNYMGSGDTVLLQKRDNNNGNMGGLFARAGIDYHINNKNTIGVSGFGMNGSGDEDSDIKYLEKYTTTDEIIRRYNRENTETRNHSNFNINLDYKHEFDKKGTELLANISYSKHKRETESTYFQQNTFPIGEDSRLTQNSDGNNESWQFKLDYTNKLTETGRLEAGWQSSIANASSGSDGFNVLANMAIPEYFYSFDYSEQIHAAYVTYGERFFKKLSVQLGLRGEYMLRDGDYENMDGKNSVDYDSYFQLFPSAYLGYAITDRDEVQLNYTRRVNRPRGRQINPFRDYSDSTNVSYGNSNLNPEFSSAFELNYIRNWDNHTLSASGYYRFADDVIQRVRYRTETNMESTFMNVSQSQESGLELVAKNRLFKILNLTSSFNLYYSKLNSADFVIGDHVEHINGREGFSWNARVMANFMFTPTFTGQVSGRYSSPRVIAQGKSEANYSIDLGVRKTFFNRNLAVSLNVRDLLDSRRRKSTTYGEGFKQYSESYWHGRTFGITATYNFGNMQPKRNETQNQNMNSMDSEIEME